MYLISRMADTMPLIPDCFVLRVPTILYIVVEIGISEVKEQVVFERKKKGK